MGNGQLKPAYNVQLAVNSEYITGVAAFSNRTDSGTLIPFLDHIQRMQGRSYRDIVADAGYESVNNYLYLEQHGQNCFIKPVCYETRKTKKYKSQLWRVENMRTDISVLVDEGCSLYALLQRKRMDLPQQQITTGAKIVPGALFGKSVSNLPIRTRTRRSGCV